jgi:uncharacterized membrane protein (DUF4010 family)
MELSPEVATAASLAVAGLAGLAVGIEREWSGHATGPEARFAGARTFLLLGLLGGLAGWAATLGYLPVTVVLLTGGAAFTVAAYVMAARRGGEAIEGTTEAAALAVLALGMVAGLGHLRLASAIAAVMVLVLREKSLIHNFVHRIGEPEFRAALQFSVLALVLLPILPLGPYGPLGGLRPRALWSVVLLFSGLNFVGYLARRAIGPAHAYGVAGLLGGLISSTAVTLGFSRQSRTAPALGTALALGTLAACTVLLFRVAVVTLVLSPPVAAALVWFLVPPALIGVGFVLVALRRHTVGSSPEVMEPSRSPLQLGSAIRMAVAFQLALMAVQLVQQLWGATGVLTTAALLGLTDMDALTLSMSRLGQQGEVSLAARAIAVGILSNTGLKLGLAASGSSDYRRVGVAGLLALGAGSALGLWLGW